MERTYFPSPQRILLYLYLAPVAVVALGFSLGFIFQLIEGRPHPQFNLWGFLGSVLAWVGINALSHGIRARDLAITLTPSTIAGPIAVGHAVPIPFDQIDFGKTLRPNQIGTFLRGKRIFSLSGDQLAIHQPLFSPEDIAEIWASIRRAESQRAAG